MLCLLEQSTIDQYYCQFFRTPMNQVRSKKKVIHNQQHHHACSQSSTHTQSNTQQQFLTIKKQTRYPIYSPCLQTTNTKNSSSLRNYTTLKIYQPTLNLNLNLTINHTHAPIKKLSTKYLKQRIYDLTTKTEIAANRNKKLISEITQRLNLRYKINECSVRILESIKNDENLCEEYGKSQREMRDILNRVEEEERVKREIEEERMECEREVQEYEREMQELERVKQQKEQRFKQLQFESCQKMKLRYEKQQRIERIKEEMQTKFVDKLLLSLFHMHILFFQKTLVPPPKTKKDSKNFKKLNLSSILCSNTDFGASLSKIIPPNRIPLALFLISKYYHYINSQNTSLLKFSFFSSQIKHIFKYPEYEQLYQQLTTKKFSGSFQPPKFEWHLSLCSFCLQEFLTYTIEQIQLLCQHVSIKVHIKHNPDLQECLLQKINTT